MDEQSIFLAAIEIDEPAKRVAYLKQACGKDQELFQQVSALLAVHEKSGEFLRSPALKQVAANSPSNEGPVETSVDARLSTDGSSSDITLSFLGPSARPDAIGKLTHYEILEIVGRGGCGIVLKAFDESLHRVVAIKVLAPELALTSPARKRFLREARATAAIRHENVIHIYAVEDQPVPFLVMEYIAGLSLQQKLDQSGPFEIDEVIRIGKQVASGLAAAHAQGLVHRDIKPGNILLEKPRNCVKLTDFGLARATDDASITQSGIIAGTPLYMSPEQAQGQTIDQRSDLFSLGSVLYVMCTGRPPFRAANTMAVLKRVVEDTPRPIPEIIPEAPAWLCELISRLQAKDPDDRPASAAQVLELLERGASGSASTPESVAKTSLKMQPHHSARRALAMATAAMLLLAVFISLGLTEAAGVTDLRGTVIRLFSPTGTLVIEVDDPGVSVSVDGEELVITGTGAKAIRLKAGQHNIRTSKAGQLLSQMPVTITKNGRQLVRISKEAADAAAAPAEDAGSGMGTGRALNQTSVALDRRPQVRSGGNWRIEGNDLVEDSASRSVILFGDPEWTDYDFEVEVNSESKIKDGHGSGVLYRATSLANHHALEIGGWSATVTEAIFQKNGKWGRTPGTFLKVPHEHHRWYKAKIEVRGPKIRCSVDGKELFVFEDADLPQGMVGLGTGNSPVRWRNLKVTATDGRILWEGLPDVGTDSQRKAAEYVLSIGGKIRIVENGVERNPTSVDELPKGAFDLRIVDFSQNLTLIDDGLAALQHCKELTHLFLQGTLVSDGGLRHLKTCTNLTLLNVQHTQVTADGVAEIKKAIANCQIEWGGSGTESSRVE